MHLLCSSVHVDVVGVIFDTCTAHMPLAILQDEVLRVGFVSISSIWYNPCSGPGTAFAGAIKPGAGLLCAIFQHAAAHQYTQNAIAPNRAGVSDALLSCLLHTTPLEAPPEAC